jgi:hypothetical protein
MHIGTPSPGWLRRPAALLASAVVALSLTAPGAVANPSPPPPGGVQLIVPKGTSVDSDQQMEDVARHLLQDPMGRELVQARLSFGTERNKSDPGNVSVEWFDLSGQSDEFYNLVLKGLRQPPTSFDIEGNYRIDTKSIGYAGNEELYKRLGAPQTSRLIQVSTSNVFHGTDSELIPLARLRAIIPAVLQRLNKGMSAAAAKAQTEAILKKGSVGLTSENSPCLNTCDAATKDFRSRLAISNYGRKGSPESKVSVANSRNVMGKATAQLRREKSRAAVQQRLAALGLDCDTVATGRTRDGGGPVLAMAALPQANPCPRNPSGGLAKALTSSDLGGVDFSTLEMRYMSDDPGSGGLRYSFSGRPVSPGTRQDIGSGVDALTNSTADLRTWLVLDPSKFWVNLNPTEPDRIIDPRLGETNAGRALLEADFQMKNTEGKLIDPHTKFGARYWNELEGSSKTLCYSSRMWIVPGDVQVREDGGSLYVLKAQLAVKAVAEHVGGLSRSCHYDPEVDARGERLEQRTVVPKIAAAINTAPEYAPIRRAFLARIVAQWIRNRHQSGHRTSFDHLIDSGNVGPARLQGDWRPRQVFDAYVHSIRDGKFTYKTTTHRGRTTIIETRTFGGVDFSKLNSTPISAAQMGQQYPQLPQTVKASTNRPATASDGSIWLGETAPTPGNGLWSRTTGTITNFVAGRTGVLIVVLVALGVVTFGIRGGSRRKRRTS